MIEFKTLTDRQFSSSTKSVPQCFILVKASYKNLRHTQINTNSSRERETHTRRHTHTHTHTHSHTLTHTHTHMLGFHVLWGLSIDVMVFILYKLYILSPYTAPIPKPNHHRRHSAILHFQKTSLSLIYKLVSSWGPKNVPTRTRILDIAIVVGTFCPHNVGYTWTTHTHTHTHTHTQTQTRTRTHTHTHSQTHF